METNQKLNENIATKNDEELSTFNERQNKRTPIQNALTRRLDEAIGKAFLVVDGKTETVQDPNDSSQTIPRAVYHVRVISDRVRLSLGTILTVKIKGKKCILSKDDERKMLLGVSHKVVAFDGLSHWVFNGNEGLSATDIRILDIKPEAAMKL